MDSSTHILVSKNGIQDEMNLTTWKAIGEDSNKDGWIRVAQPPIEVINMKKKIAEGAPELAPAESNVDVIDPSLEVKEIKRKYIKK